METHAAREEKLTPKSEIESNRKAKVMPSLVTPILMKVLTLTRFAMTPNRFKHPPIIPRISDERPNWVDVMKPFAFLVAVALKELVIDASILDDSFKS